MFKTYHVLGERLAKSNVVALLNEMANCESVLVSVTTGKSLVSHVEKGKVALVLDNIGDLLPLLLAGVNTSGIVSTCVEKEDTAVGSRLDVGDQTLEIESDGLLVIVAILLNLEAGVVENSLVISPRRLRNVDLLLAREELGKEGGADTEGTGARDGLCDSDAVQGGVVGTIGQLCGGRRELRNTSNAGILLVQLGLDDLLLGLANGGEDVGLASIIAVGTNTCIRTESDQFER